jgi:RNA polymerase sigma-70 factor (ECF subfamily)
MIWEMPRSDDNSGSIRWREVGFATTLWSVVEEAKEGTESKAGEALAQLCQVYWYPLYAYVRRRGYNRPDAEDLVQGFFAQLLVHRAIQRVTSARGRFRSFLLASLNHFLSDQRDRARAKKRGGGRETISFDATDAEGRYWLEPVDERTPEQLFERRWALTVLEQVLARLEQEYTASNQRELFDELRPFLLGDRSHGTYAEAASRRGVSEGTIKMAVSRLRRRYQELFREAIAQTVAQPGEVADEMRHLVAVLRE